MSSDEQCSTGRAIGSALGVGGGRPLGMHRDHCIGLGEARSGTRITRRHSLPSPSPGSFSPTRVLCPGGRTDRGDQGHLVRAGSALYRNPR